MDGRALEAYEPWHPPNNSTSRRPPAIRSGAWEDPFAWGIVLADLARHIALAQQIQHPETDTDAFVERLLEGFHAEIENPTDEPEGEVTQ